jgi:hypothetical protein
VKRTPNSPVTDRGIVVEDGLMKLEAFPNVGEVIVASKLFP